MRGGVRPGAGRKPKIIELGELEKLCAMHCSDEDLAGWFHVSPRTIQNRKKQAKFAEAMAAGRARGCIAVRREQVKILERGNAAMAIWLGRQWLGQKDVTPIEVSGPNEQPIKFTLEAIDAILAKARKRKKIS
jgi:hypothetical protein